MTELQEKLLSEATQGSGKLDRATLLEIVSSTEFPRLPNEDWSGWPRFVLDVRDYWGELSIESKIVAYIVAVKGYDVADDLLEIMHDD
jgi:hypothetical protein